MTKNVGPAPGRRARLGCCAAALAFAPGSASAHVGLGRTHGLVQGFFHPLSGSDHVLAMVAVGLFAAQLGGRALWLLPSSFIAVMAFAAAAGLAGVGLPFVEIGIALSLVALGSAIALRSRLPTLAAMALVGFFAMFHGYAHGAETPESTSGLLYGAGFICATALLLTIGVGSGLAIGRAAHRGRLVQVGGAAIAIAGLAILASP